MVTRKPLIVNASANQIQELPAGDSVDGIATLTATTLVGNGVVPIGGIIMWSGTIASLASSAPNFKLCDGSNGTPDLTNRFVIGANVDDGGVAKSNIETISGVAQPKQSGGFKNAVLLSHRHGYAFASKDDPAVIGNDFQASAGEGISNVTEHADINELSQSGGDDGSDLAAFTADTENVGINKDANISRAQTGNNANLPPYFALAYIMRVS